MRKTLKQVCRFIRDTEQERKRKHFFACLHLNFTGEEIPLTNLLPDRNTRKNYPRKTVSVYRERKVPHNDGIRRRFCKKILFFIPIYSNIAKEILKTYQGAIVIPRELWEAHTHTIEYLLKPCWEQVVIV